MPGFGLGLGFDRARRKAGGGAPAIKYTYRRPGGVDTYHRPDGTSIFNRP